MIAMPGDTRNIKCVLQTHNVSCLGSSIAGERRLQLGQSGWVPSSSERKAPKAILTNEAFGRIGSMKTRGLRPRSAASTVMSFAAVNEFLPSPRCGYGKGSDGRI